MSDFLTTRQLQDLLQVDRTTIYRMADSGRVPAVKVGNQWRFPRRQIEAWLRTRENSATAAPAASPAADELRRLLPLECVQLIQDTFADALKVTVFITGLDGEPVTQPSHPCGLFSAVTAFPEARRLCMQDWAAMARQPSLQPAFLPSHLGLLCARGLIRCGSELCGMVVFAGLAPQQWPPDAQALEAMASGLGLPAALLHAHVHEVHHADTAEQLRLLTFVQRIADVISHIVQERNTIFGKLHNIAELTRV